MQPIRSFEFGNNFDGGEVTLGVVAGGFTETTAKNADSAAHEKGDPASWDLEPSVRMSAGRRSF